MKEQAIPQNARQDSELSLCAVPESERKSYISLTIIWTGFIFAIISLMAGGSLAMGLSFQEIMIVSLIGNVFLCAIAIAVSVIASRTGLTFALLTRYSFGSGGSKVASLFVPIVNVGWYTIQSASYGHFVARVFGFGAVGEAICMVLSAVLMGVFAFYGVKAITILGYIAIPAIIFLTIASTIRSMGVLGSVEALFAYRPAATLLKPHEADFYYTFLNALGNVIPPLAGIIVVNKGRYLPLEKSRFVAWNPIPWISWVVSVIIVFTLAAVAPRVQENISAPFIGIVLGAVFHIILMKATKTKVNLAETEEK